MTFTDAQLEVINARGGNLVVSAAAGSGKTAVLTERILQRILRDKADITRLLVVTFTRAAAAEMRERILAAIDRQLLEEPENEHLRRQSVLIHHAKITTIDSFCSFLLKEHFREAGLDPATRMGQEAEIASLKQEAVEELLEESFAAGAPDFLSLADTFGKTAAANDFSEALIRLSDFADSDPEPEKWLEGCADAEAWKELLVREARERLSGLGELARAASRCAGSPAGPWFYQELLSAEEEKLKALCRLAMRTPDVSVSGNDQQRDETDSPQGDNAGLSFGSWYEALREALASLEFGRLPAKKDDTVSTGLREQAKALRNGVKDGIKKLKEKFFFRPFDEAIRMEEELSRELKLFAGLTLSFRERLREKKKEKKLMDFSDLEHMAYGLLIRDGRPTEIAKAYQEHFQEIFIDEYQDSNLLQEGILKAISREESPAPDRFLVGDVKQSIYRFRQARPELIMEKLETYKEGPGPFRRIDLDQNFRSRKEVLKLVNFCFRQLMGKAVGGVEYDERAFLKYGAKYEESNRYSIPHTRICAASGPNSTDPIGISASADIPQAAASRHLGKYQDMPGFTPELLLVVPPKEQEEELWEEPDQAEGAGDAETAAAMAAGAEDPEAVAVGERILSLVGKQMIYDKETEEYRPARFKDITILLRSLKGPGERWQKLLQEMGIPAYVTSRTGYFSATEVQTLLQALRVFHNPLEDIPLFGLMHSVFGGFSDEELALIRISASPENRRPAEADPVESAAETTENSDPDDPPRTLYGDLVFLQQEENRGRLSGELYGKLCRFLSWIGRYREKAAYTPVRSLIRELIYGEGYLNLVAAMPGGERRKANVELLLLRAASFEESGILSLHRFVRYLDRLEKLEVDYGEAAGADEKADVVRIMSIHGSKGLEFPICFVSGLQKRFNRMDERERVLADMDTGAAMDLIGADRIRRRSLKRHVIAGKLQREALGEELRVLYVAMTRAREKLILTGCVKDPAKALAKHSALFGREEEAIPPAELLSAGSFLDLIMAAISRNRAADPLLGEDMERPEGPLYHEQVLALCLQEEKPAGAVKEGAYSLAEKRERLLHPAPPETQEDLALAETIRERFAWRYPFAQLAGLYTKTTVTRLKMQAMEGKVLEIADEGKPAWPEEEQISPGGSYEEILPRFAGREEAVTGSFRGSAYHRALELIDLNAEHDAQRLQEELDRLTASGRLREEQRAVLDPARLMAFLRSPLAARMGAALREGKLFRERPFVIGIPASEQDPAFPEDELVLIQGIIDAYFEEDGELVVMDYKTDRVRTGEELVRRYKTQLDYYARALHQLTGMRVKEKLIYSLALNKEERLP